MDYAAAVAAAPPGWRHFTRQDVDRLPGAVRRHFLPAIPAADRRRMAEGEEAATERVLRAMFWTLVYHLEPERWDALALTEPISPTLVGVLPHVERALDVGAGSGRLTAHVRDRVGRVLAVEPSLGLLHMLRRRLPGVLAVAAWAEAMPVAGGWSQLTVACGAFGPDPAVLRELDRVTCRGGTIALVNPERPEWFSASGWERHDVTPAKVLVHEPWVDEFFGPPDPPRVVVIKRS